MQDINLSILQTLNDLTINPIIASLAPLLADLPIFFLPLFLGSMWLYYRFHNGSMDQKFGLMHIFYACIIGIIMSLIIQQFVDIGRPELALEGAKGLILEHVPDASFPSDHATVSVAFLIALYHAHYKRVFWAFLPWVILMNLSRIVVGVHWPFDIVAGTLVGAVAAYISCRLLNEIKFVKKFNSFIIQLLQYIKL